MKSKDSIPIEIKRDSQGIRIPFYKRHHKYQRSQIVKDCKNCEDTSFELLENGKLTDKCCRCGEKY